MLNIYVKMGQPSECAYCGRVIRRGQRTVTDGRHDFDTCKCEMVYNKREGA